MKKLTAKIFAFIIAFGMFTGLPQLTFAQGKKKCPKGYYQVCYTDPWSGAKRCTCFPSPSGSLINDNINETPEIETHSIPNSNGIAIDFQLMDAQNVSLKIYDGTGRLVKTLSNNRMSQGEHEIEWNTKDENGYLVTAGNYVLQFTKGSLAVIKKIPVTR